MVDQPFIEPEQRANNARSEFRKAYIESLAVKLKKSWNTDTMVALGYQNEIDPVTGKPRDPGNEQFTAWAEELINNGGFTFKGKDGKAIGKPVTIELMQSSLDDKAKEQLRKDFGTDQLRDVILTREQLNNVSQQVGRATYDHSGSLSFLKGATIMDAIRGFFDWMLSGFKSGKDGGFFSGLTDAIKARAANGVGNDLKEMLDNNPSGIHEGVRKYIADKVTQTGREQVGLDKPNTPPETLKNVKVGQDVPKTQSTGDRIKPPVELTNDPKKDLPARFEKVALDSVAPFMGAINSKPENKETLDKVLKVFKEEGTTLAMSDAGKKLSKEEFTKQLLETTKKKLAEQGMNVNDPQVAVVLPMVEKQLLADHENIMKIAGGKASEVTQKPDAVKPPPTTTLNPPAPTTGDAAKDLPARFETVALKSVEPFMAVINAKPENKETLDKVLKAFKEEGTALATSKEGQALSKEEFAKKLLETTKKKLGDQGMNVNDPQVAMVLPLVEKELLADHENIMKIAKGKGSEVVQKPDTVKPPAGLPKDVVKQQVFNELALQALEGIENGIIKQVREQRASLDTSPKPEPINTRLKERMDGLLKEAESTDPKVKAEGRAKIMAFATAMGGPNQAQREAMAKEVADATADVLLQKENKGKTKEELAPQIEKAVRERLTAQRGAIEVMGGKFKLADAQINEAAALVGKTTRELDEKVFANVVMAQNMVDYSAPDKKPPAEMKFDVKRAKDYAKTMPAVISDADMRKAIFDQVRSQTVANIDAERRNVVAGSFTATILDADVQTAISAGYAPNDYQRDHIADVVADATTRIMMDTSIPDNAKSSRVRAEVSSALKAEKDALNKSQSKGGYANDKANMFVLGWYKWEIKDEDINKIADKAELSIEKRRGDFAQMNLLGKPMQVEAPSVPKTPSPTQVATR